MPQKNGALKTSAPFCFSLSKPFCRLGSSNLLKHPQAEEPVGGGQVQVDRLQQIRVTGTSAIPHTYAILDVCKIFITTITSSVGEVVGFRLLKDSPPALWTIPAWATQPIAIGFAPPGPSGPPWTRPSQSRHFRAAGRPRGRHRAAIGRSG